MKRILLFCCGLVLLSSAALAQLTSLKHLGSFNPSTGTPDYIVSQSGDTWFNTLEKVRAALPENEHQPSLQPQWFANPEGALLYFSKASDVYLTFLDKQTNNNNSLVFYTYVGAPNANNGTVAFPAVTRAEQGGALVTGSKIYLGTFTAGTTLGFALIPNGWQNSGVQIRNPVFYSHPQWNPESSPQQQNHALLLKGLTTNPNDLVLAMEDTRGDIGAMQDFNDNVFALSLSDASAVNTYALPLVTIDLSIYEPFPNEITVTPDPPIQRGPVEREGFRICYCEGALVNATEFTAIVNAVKKQKSPTGMKSVMRQATNGKCLSIEQTKQLIGLIRSETDKLEMAKMLYDRTDEKDQYYQVSSLLFFTSNVQSLEQYTASKPYMEGPFQYIAVEQNGEIEESPTITLAAGCAGKTLINATELASIKKSISAETYSSDQMNVLKLATRNKCIKTEDASQLIALFTYEEDKVAAAKFLYDRCADPDNYYKVKSQFVYSTSKEELTEYMMNR